MTRATVQGLRSLVRPEDVAQLRGKTISEVLPWKPPPVVEEEAAAEVETEAPAAAAPAAEADTPEPEVEQTEEAGS